MLIVNCPCSATNTKCTPNTIHQHLLLIKNDWYRFTMLQLLINCQVEFPFQFQSFMTIFHFVNVRMQNIANFVSMIDVDDLIT